MSEAADGLMIQTQQGTYFIPESDLSSYRLPDDLAEAVADDLAPEVGGFSFDAPTHKGVTMAVVTPMKFEPILRPEPKRIMLHTATRL